MRERGEGGKLEATNTMSGNYMGGTSPWKSNSFFENFSFFSFLFFFD